MCVIRFIVRFALLLGLSLCYAPVYLLVWKLRGRMPAAIAASWSRQLGRVLGLRIEVSGSPSDAGRTLFVCNHVSYLDIVVLAALLDARFVSKDDVQRWPVVGRLAAWRGTYFIDRRSLRRSAALCASLREALRNFDLILFPEGTTSNGETVLRFKTTLFNAVMDDGGQALAVQPISLCYVRDRQGRLLDGPRADQYAWYRDMTLAPHFARVLCRPGAVVSVRFHEVIAPGAHDDRKALAAASECAVRQGVAASWGMGAN